MASEVQTVNLTYRPREPFKTFHQRHQRWSILVYHRRAGKTVATVNDLVAKALRCRKPNGKFAYVAPYMGQAESVAWTYLQDAVRAIPNHKIDITKKRVFVPSAHGTPAEIRLFGADNPDNLRGQYFDGVVLDEVAQMKRTVWGEVIRPALSDRKGWAVFIGTPKGRNFFYDLYERARKDPARWFCQVLKASESGILTKEELADSRAEADQETYDQEYECSFTAGIKGAYYATLIVEAEAEGRISDLPVVSAAPVHLAFDLGWNDSTAVWFYQIIHGELRIVDHAEWSKIDILQIVSDVRSRGYNLGEWWLPHDAKHGSLQTGKSMVELLRDHDIRPRVVPKLGKLDGIQAVRYTLPKMRFDATRCYQGIEALKNYHKEWNAEQQVFRATPHHDWSSHSADAMRYLCLAVRDVDISDSVPRKKKASPVIQVPGQGQEVRFEPQESPYEMPAPAMTTLTLDELWAPPSSGYVRI